MVNVLFYDYVLCNSKVPLLSIVSIVIPIQNLATELGHFTLELRISKMCATTLK